MLTNFAGWNFGFWDNIMIAFFVFGIPVFFIMLIIWAISGGKNKKAGSSTEYIRKKDPNFWIIAVLGGLMIVVTLILLIYSFFE